MSAQEREAIIKLKTQSKAIRETTNLLAHSIWCTPKHQKGHRGQLKCIVAELFPRLSKIASQHPTKSRTNSRKSLQKSTIKRRLDEWKYSEFTITSKALVTLQKRKNQKAAKRACTGLRKVVEKLE